MLHYGSCTASAAFAVGLVLALSANKLAVLRDMRLVAIGIALFLLLPVLRMVLMLIVFLRERNYRFSAIAALV